MTYTHIAYDIYGIAIMAIGTSAENAVAVAAEESGADADGIIARKATPALIAQVEEQGGAIAWGRIDDVACTIDEEDAEDAEDA